MASFLARPSRILSAQSRCTRHFASSTPVCISQRPGVTTSDNHLVALLDDVTNEVSGSQHGNGGNFQSSSSTSAYRSVEFNRQQYERPSYRRRVPLGPGREARYRDIFLQHEIDPRREAHNEELMSGYMSRLGQIKPRSVTNLSQRSQRLVGKAIKRAKMMGVVPVFSNMRMRRLEVRSDTLANNDDAEDTSEDKAEENEKEGKDEDKNGKDDADK
ncbi:hypothetical protein ACEPAG_6219 [Sanghuangporus baumii]